MSDDRTAIPCYVARCKCGCGGLIFASVDDPARPEDKKATAKSVADVIRRGYAVERMTVGEVRAAQWMCEKDRPPSLEDQ